MSDVFISYAREDAANIKKIAEALKLLGLEVWFDERIPSGSSFNEIIWQELEGAKAILVGWSTKSCRSTWVMSEAMVGQNNDKLVAFFLEPCTLIPPFNLAQAEDLANWEGDWTSHGWRKIVERIGALVGRPALVGQPGAPGLCEALADKSGHQLAVWARTYPEDPYADKIHPLWESRQRESFAAELAAARKQVEGLLKKRQAQTKANFATMEREFETWIALGPQARQTERPDPKALAASLVGPLGKRHGTVIVDPEPTQPPATPARPEPEKQGDHQSLPAVAEPARAERASAAATPEPVAPLATVPAPPRRHPIWQAAAVLVLGGVLGGGITFLGTHAAAPSKGSEASASDHDAAVKAAADNEALRGQLAKATTETNALKEHLDAATASDESLTRQLSDSQSSLRTAQAQISQGSDRDTTIRTLDAAKKSAESERDAAQGQLEAARRQMASLTSERDDAQSQLETARRQSITLVGERDSLQAQVDDKSRALQGLQDKLAAAQTSSEQDLGVARAQIALLKNQLSQASCPVTTSASQVQASAGACYVSGTDPNGYGWIALRYAPNKTSRWSNTHLTEGMHLDVLSRSGDYWKVRVGSEEGYAASQFIRCE